MPQPALSITHKNSVAFIIAVMNSTSRTCLMLLWTTASPANSLVINHPVQSLDGISIWEEEMQQHCKTHDAWVLLPQTHWTDAGIRTTCFISSCPHFLPIYSDNPSLHVYGTGISPWLNALGAVVVHNHRKKTQKKPNLKQKKNKNQKKPAKQKPHKKQNNKTKSNKQKNPTSLILFEATGYKVTYLNLSVHTAVPSDATESPSILTITMKTHFNSTWMKNKHEKFLCLSPSTRAVLSQDKPAAIRRNNMNFACWKRGDKKNDFSSVSKPRMRLREEDQ